MEDNTNKRRKVSIESWIAGGSKRTSVADSEQSSVDVVQMSAAAQRSKRTFLRNLKTLFTRLPCF